MSKRILVVEDQPDNRQIIRDMLAPTDYEITEAENGQQALAVIAKQRPDLILMGVQLPILPSTLAASESDGGLGVKMVFERHIVWPDGHREIEGVTPKQLPAPSPVLVENNDQLICVEKPSQNSASDDQ
jgi:hypothetical protein